MQWQIQTFRYGRGGDHTDPEMGGGGTGLKKNSFRAFGSQFDLKIRGPPGPPSVDLPLKCHYWETQKKLAYLGYSDKLRIQSKSQQRLWKLRKKVKRRQRNKAQQLSYHDKWMDGVPLLTQRGWKSLILQGSTDFWIQNLRSFPDFFPKQSFLYPDSKLSNTPWFLKGRLALIQD